MTMPHNLSIHATPFKPSKLSLPASPFSPLSPLTPKAPKRKLCPSPTRQRSHPFPPPPPSPLNWLWQCHMCSRIYRLDTTRRCLEDGHFFCSGTTTVKRSKRSGAKARRHHACTSEFDYHGWRAWGEWKSTVNGVEGGESDSDSDEEFGDLGWPRVGDPAVRKNCWARCDYPSECRWGKKYGVRAGGSPAGEQETKTTKKKTTEVELDLPSVSAANGVDSDSLLPINGSQPSTTFEDILFGLASTMSEDLTLSPSHIYDVATQESSSSRISPPPSPVQEEATTKQTTAHDVQASAYRRNRRSLGYIASPLASHPVTPPTSASPNAGGSDEKATRKQKDLPGQDFIDISLNPDLHLAVEGGTPPPAPAPVLLFPSLYAETSEESREARGGWRERRKRAGGAGIDDKAHGLRTGMEGFGGEGSVKKSLVDRVGEWVEREKGRGIVARRGRDR